VLRLLLLLLLLLRLLRRLLRLLLLLQLRSRLLLLVRSAALVPLHGVRHEHVWRDGQQQALCGGEVTGVDSRQAAVDGSARQGARDRHVAHLQAYV
jgi:hypothetical protein